MRSLVCLIITLLTVNTLYAQSEPTKRFERIAEIMMRGINEGNFHLIQNEYGANMADFTFEQTTYFFQSLIDRLGKATRVDQFKIVSANRADFIMYFERGAQAVQLYLDNQNKIAGYLFSEYTPPPQPIEQPRVQQPVVTVPTVPDKQKTPLYLPFKGRWSVVSGGEPREGTAARNLLTQQYSYDFVALDNLGRQYRGTGEKVDDYIGFGQDVLAPADGVVVDVIDGVRDNPPGNRNIYALLGNTIVIQHQPNEYSVLGYLKQNSIRVRVGQQVTRGQVIAQCGNSGNSVEPSLHFHLQDSPIMGVAKGIKFYFERVYHFQGDQKQEKSLFIPKTGDVLSSE
ncbi:MAG: M23 family metallopeptidase [Bacteroidetes bacterium]|nr:M23 family metallopeptidase [Bacteroidota bacterium]